MGRFLFLSFISCTTHDSLDCRTLTSSLNWSSRSRTSLSIKLSTAFWKPFTPSLQVSLYSSMCFLQEKTTTNKKTRSSWGWMVTILPHFQSELHWWVWWSTSHLLTLILSNYLSMLHVYFCLILPTSYTSFQNYSFLIDFSTLFVF